MSYGAMLGGVDLATPFSISTNTFDDLSAVTSSRREESFLL